MVQLACAMLACKIPRQVPSATANKGVHSKLIAAEPSRVVLVRLHVKRLLQR
jgi:hypothetical protein